MTINSLQDAFDIIENPLSEEFPIEAIKYLYEHEYSNEIEEKIVFYIENAFNFEKINLAYDAPLWYLIVAEHHLSERFIRPLIKSYTHRENDNDLYNEQGLMVLGLLTEKSPEKVIPIIIETIQNQLKNKNDSPYLYLYEVLYHEYAKNYKDTLLEIAVHPNLSSFEVFIHVFSTLDIKEAIPIIKKKLLKFKKIRDFFDQQSVNELKSVLSELENDNINPDHLVPYHRSRKKWEEHYEFLAKNSEYTNYEDPIQNYTHMFEDIVMTKVNTIPKTGRNDPCPCNSGKKYKKCCLKIA